MNSAPDERTIGMRIHTQSPFGSAWLSRVLVPVVRTLRADHNASVAYLGRGWKNGPHVDLVAYGPRTVPWDDIAETTNWRENELPPVIDGKEYLAQARELGRLERVPPPYLPLLPRGTVTWIQDRTDAQWPLALDGPRDRALTRMFVPISRLLDLSAARDGAVPVVALAEAFIALCTAHPRGLAHGVFSLRSHAEAFLHWASAAKDPRPSFRRRLAADAATFGSLVERARAGGESGEAAEWRAAFSYGLGAFDAAVAAGDLSPGLLDELAPPAARETMGPPGPPGRVSAGRSDFHETVSATGVTDDPSGWFASYRALINLFYSRLPLLGVTPIQRYYLCFAVAETVDEVYGTSWRERLGHGAGRKAA